MVLQRSRSPAQGMGSLHPHNQRVDQDSFVARESSQEELLGMWTACSQIQNGEIPITCKKQCWK